MFVISVSEVHGFESGLVGWFGFQGSRAFAVRMSAVALASEGLTGAPFQWYTHLTVGRRLQVLTKWAFAEATEYLYGMVAGFPQTARRNCASIIYT